MEKVLKDANNKYDLMVSKPRQDPETKRLINELEDIVSNGMS